jgi:hypothetical protein
MTFSDGTPSTVSEMLLIMRRNITDDTGMRVRWHRSYGHGLRPGEDRDLGCPNCTREDRNRVPCGDCGGGYWQEYAGPPPSDQYIPHASICPAVAS